MKDFIGRLYRWFYYEALQRQEPFTWQFCRIQENTPFIFWSIVIALGGFGWNLIFTGELWQQIIGIAGLGIEAWFIGHIIDSIQEHDWKPNPHD